MEDIIISDESIAPKSDQLNADDLLTRRMVITVTGVTKGNAQQPYNIHFQGDAGRPYRPCKSMIRLLTVFWGRRASDWVGRSMELYNDTGVKFGGQAVGGIRISKLSHIENQEAIALTVSRGKKKDYVVEPLLSDQPRDDELTLWKRNFFNGIQTAQSLDEMIELDMKNAHMKDQLRIESPESHKKLSEIIQKRMNELNKSNGE